jgi:hypothetical protein
VRVDFWSKPLILVSGVVATGVLCPFHTLGLSELQAQTRTSAGYEVASIKRSNSTFPRSGGIQFLPGGRFRSTNMFFLYVSNWVSNWSDLPLRRSDGPHGPIRCPNRGLVLNLQW